MTYTDDALDALLKLAEKAPQAWREMGPFISASREAIPRLVGELRETRKSFTRCLNERASLRSQLARIAELDADKLDLLADWFDQDDANKGRSSLPEVQADLRHWAKTIRSLLASLEQTK